jgi:hypothetical protein
MLITHPGHGFPKIHYQTDQEGLLRSCGGHMCQLLGDDGVKSAASSLFSRSELDKHRPDKNHFGLHIVIMGDSETYGQNKNGDIWPKQACATYHPTFVSHGAMFREHRNRSAEKQGIGLIKAAAYSDAKDSLRRIELILHGNIKKANEEYELARDGKELSFSMSARVPYDECNCCHNKAKRASAYCDHLRFSMGQYLPEFQKYAGAINDHPTFFDASRVRNPADRIAHYLEYRFHDDDMQKAASENRVISGAEWAEFEGVCLPAIPQAFSLEKQALLYRLAQEEADLDQDAPGEKSAFVRTAVPYALRYQMSDVAMEDIRALRPGTFFRELAKQACVLPFFTFAAYAMGGKVSEAPQDSTVIAASELLPGVFRDLVKSGCSELDNLFGADSDYSAECDSALTGRVRGHIKTAGDLFSLDSDRLCNRILTASSAGLPVERKEVTSKMAATVDNRAQVLAESYAHYQLNALDDISNITGTLDNHRGLLAVASNRYIYR